MHKTFKKVFLCVLKHTYMHGPRWQKDVDSGRRILLLYKFPSCDCCKGVEVFEMGWQLLICYQYKSTRTNNIKPLDQAKKVVQYSRGYHKTYCCNVETVNTITVTSAMKHKHYKGRCNFEQVIVLASWENVLEYGKET